MVKLQPGKLCRLWDRKIHFLDLVYRLLDLVSQQNGEGILGLHGIKQLERILIFLQILGVLVPYRWTVADFDAPRLTKGYFGILKLGTSN